MRHLIVGGAGIGGLTAAIALAHGGDRVTVFERRPALAEFGAGLQLAPNATRILAGVGLLDTTRARSTEPAAIRIRRARDGDTLALMPLTESGHRFGAPFLLIHRADLQRTLMEAAAALPCVTIRLGEAVDGAAVGENEAALGHGFVDARGIGSRLALAETAPRATQIAWRALVPAEALPPALTRNETTLWLGPAAHLVHYPLRGGTLVNVVAISPIHRTAGGEDELWSRAGDPDMLRRHFRGWHRDACRLLDGVAAWRCWPLFDPPPLPEWGRGTHTRLGDAAHPMLPFLAQGASQALEDAGALAAALAETADVATAFRRYEHRRAPRAARVQRASRWQGDLYHLGRPASDARDLVMHALGGRRALARMDWLYRPA